MTSVETFPTTGRGAVTLRTHTRAVRGTTTRDWACTCGAFGGDTLPDGTRLTAIQMTQTAAAHAAECTD